MKKTITKPDGSIEVFEGTAQEIADYERKLKGQPQLEAPKPSGPGLLTDEVTREMRKYLDNPLIPKYNFAGYHLSHCELVTARSGWFSITPPSCTCGAETKYVPFPFGWDLTCTNVSSH